MDNELKHFGIPGMHWGRRKARPSGPPSEDYSKKQQLQKKHVSEMTNAELKDLTTRLQLESQYSTLSKKKASAGREFITGILKDVGKEMIKDAIKGSVKKGVSKGSKAVTSKILKK